MNRVICMALGALLLAGVVTATHTSEQFIVSVPVEKSSSRDRQNFQNDMLGQLELYTSALIDELAAFSSYLAYRACRTGNNTSLAVPVWIWERIKAVENAALFVQSGERADMQPTDSVDAQTAVSARSDDAIIAHAVLQYATIQKQLLRTFRGLLEHDIDCFFVRVKNRKNMKRYMQTIQLLIAESSAAAQKMRTLHEETAANS